MKKFARKCDISGKGINEGFCFNDGEKYFANEKDLISELRTNDFVTAEGTQVNSFSDEDLKEWAYNDEIYYWTEWEVEEGENYFDKDGNEYNENGILVNDLFNEDPISLPIEVQNILNYFVEKNGDSYENCAHLVAELEKVGYTCEYYLDAQPFNLKKK